MSLCSTRSPAHFTLRRAVPEDRERLVDVWWRSVRATHHFLTTAEIESLLPEVRALRLELLQTWVLCATDSAAIGFMVMDRNAIEALFIAPEWQRRGGGTLLMRQAARVADRLVVDVNEQNAGALAFYIAQGFEVVRRSATDRSGRPYPLLHLAESSSVAGRHRFSQVRFARPVTDLEKSAAMYIQGLRLVELGRFENHAGFDGVMLGRADLGFHFEFTRARQAHVRPSSTPEDLIVLYLPHPDEWREACARLVLAGFTPVSSFNPYWEQHGRTFADPDGYRVVLENDRWPGMPPAAFPPTP